MMPRAFGDLSDYEPPCALGRPAVHLVACRPPAGRPGDQRFGLWRRRSRRGWRVRTCRAPGPLDVAPGELTGRLPRRGDPCHVLAPPGPGERHLLLAPGRCREDR